MSTDKWVCDEKHTTCRVEPIEKPESTQRGVQSFTPEEQDRIIRESAKLAEIFDRKKVEFAVPYNCLVDKIIADRKKPECKHTSISLCDFIKPTGHEAGYFCDECNHRVKPLTWEVSK